MINRINTPILILVDGPSGSGKTTVSNEILKSLPNNLSCLIVNQDRYYKDSLYIENNGLNYDHPNSFDWNLIIDNINNLMNFKPTMLPLYDYVKYERLKEFEKVESADVIIFEGIYALYNKEINDMALLKIFVDTPMDECLIRRILRDTKERQRSIDSIIEQWRKTVCPMYKAFIEPLKSQVDIILPWNNNNPLGINILRHGLNGIIKENELLSKK